MVDIIGEERVRETVSMTVWIDNYNTFMKAKNLGIKFSPNDLNIEQLEIFSIINETMLTHESKTQGKKKK